jgi:hypothetical protein
MILDNRSNRNTNEEDRIIIEHPNSSSRTFGQEGTITTGKIHNEKDESHKEGTFDIEESDDRSYSDSSFIPEDDFCEKSNVDAAH